MTRRRLRLPELVALLAVTTPVLAGQPDSPTSTASGAASGTASGTPSVGDSARQLGASVKRSSAELGQHVANGAREAGQKLSAGMQQAGQSLHRWWDGARGSDAHSQAGAPQTSLPQSASLQSNASLGSPTASAKSQGSNSATGQSWP